MTESVDPDAPSNQVSHEVPKVRQGQGGEQIFILQDEDILLIDRGGARKLIDELSEVLEDMDGTEMLELDASVYERFEAERQKTESETPAMHPNTFLRRLLDTYEAAEGGFYDSEGAKGELTLAMEAIGDDDPNAVELHLQHAMKALGGEKAELYRWCDDGE